MNSIVTQNSFQLSSTQLEVLLALVNLAECLIFSQSYEGAAYYYLQSSSELKLPTQP
jgi:hypothetical protein